MIYYLTVILTQIFIFITLFYIHKLELANYYLELLHLSEILNFSYILLLTTIFNPFISYVIFPHR